MRTTKMAAIGATLLAALSVSVAALGTTGRAGSQSLMTSSPAPVPAVASLAVTGGSWGCVQGNMDGLNVNGTGPAEAALIVYYCNDTGQTRKKGASVTADADGKWTAGLLLTEVQAMQNSEPPLKYLKVCKPNVTQQPPDGCSHPWPIIAGPQGDPCP